jgi:hypothetical protein
MSRLIRLGMAAGLALTASGAWATAGRSDEKSAGGDVWYDEFYSCASPAAATPASTSAAASHRPRATAVAGQHPHKRARAGERDPARADHHRLARSH